MEDKKKGQGKGKAFGKGFRCYNCDEEGHIAIICLHRPKDQAALQALAASVFAIMAATEGPLDANPSTTAEPMGCPVKPLVLRMRMCLKNSPNTLRRPCSSLEAHDEVAEA